MKKAILKALSIEQGEESKVFLLLLQSFFLGCYMATYETVATALFQDYFEDKDFGFAMVVSGSVGIIFSIIYTFLQKKINFSGLAVGVMVLVTAITFVLRAGFNVVDPADLVFVIFLMFGPLNVVAMLSFWGIVTRVFNLRQGKRLFGLVDTGLIIGMIVISFSIPVIQSLFSAKQDILLISGIAAACALAIQFMLSVKFNKDINKTDEEPASAPDQKVKKSVSWLEVVKSKYLSSLSLFVIFSMVGAFFIWSQWMSVGKQYFPETDNRINFIGIFIAIVMVFTLLIKTFVYSRIMKTYGLKVALIALPILLTVFTAIAFLIGHTMGYTALSANFALFFLVINLSRLFSQSIKLAIEAPAMKLLFQPLDSNIRYDAQAKIDGTVNEFAGIVAGAALSLLANQLIVTTVLVVILVAWLIVTFKAYKEYQSTLKSSLDAFKTEQEASEEIQNADFSDVLISELNTSHPDKIIYALHLSENMEPRLHESSIQSLLESDIDQVKVYALNKISETMMLDTKAHVEKVLESGAKEEIKSLAKKTMEILETEGRVSGASALDKLAKSKSSADREHAAKLLGTLPVNEHHTHLLVDLIRDLEPNVRLATINVGAKLNVPELYPFIIDNLANPKYTSAATSAVISLGEYIIQALDTAFYKAGYDSTSLIRITRILGNIGGEKAQQYLVNKLTYPDKKVISQALVSLKESNYSTDEKNKPKILQRVEDYIGYIGWNLVALDEIDTDTIGDELKIALEEETANNYNLLYLLLSLVYDPHTIKNIRKNIETGTSESIGYAIELLDLFVDESLKPKLFPLIEDMPVAEKMRAMEIFYPRLSLSSTEVLLDLINRDYTVTNRWTKAAAIHAYGQMPKVEVTQDLIANLFNPDALIRESAAQVVYNLNPTIFDKTLSRLDKAEKVRLERLVKTVDKQKRQTQYEKIAFLKGVKGFDKMTGLTLAEVTDYFETLSFKDGQSIYAKGTGQHKHPLQFIFKGSVILKNGESDLRVFRPQEAIGEMLILDSDLEQTEISASEEVITFAIRDESLYGLMYNHKDIAEAIITILNERVMLQKA